MAIGLSTEVGVRGGERSIDFDREIRPVLSRACFQCHGPDEEQREADLRLDLPAATLADLGGHRVIVPGDLDSSELYRRITSADEDQRMPPKDSGHKLSPQQIRLIGQWIQQGAIWKAHWSFIPPSRPRLPRVRQANWPRNAIDHFVLSRLEREGMTPSNVADRTTLIRRVTLDLTGLPPTPHEVEQFLNDQSPLAYEQLIGRLLSSPRFGERIALPWLDAARYADTSGYQNDGPRTMWRWRDWVIDALNHNMPFDQFTIEQLAGDMLPGATLNQRIATGFNRNHRGNAEGGIIPEEYAVEYVVDRVDTTSTVWLGLTMACARCHDHKFDPISQREFYQFFAYFNNVPESGRAIKEGNSPPWVNAPTIRQQAELRRLDREVATANEHFKSLQSELTQAQLRWEQSYSGKLSGSWSISRGLVAHFALDGNLQESTDRSAAASVQDGSARYGKGVHGEASDFDGRLTINAGDVGNFGYFDKFSLAAWVDARADEDSPASAGTIVSRMTDTARASGYSVMWKDGRIHVNLVKRWLDDAIRVKTVGRWQTDRWHHVCVTYDGSRLASGVAVYVNGHRQPLHVDLDLINQSFATTEPLRIAGGGGTANRFVGLIDDVRIFDRCLPAGDVEVLATQDDISRIVATDRTRRSKAAARKLQAYFIDQLAPKHIRQAHAHLLNAQQRRDDFREQIPTVMVMQEMDHPRDTYVLRRGQYDQPGEAVFPGLPACLPPIPDDGVENDRLGLARWIVQPTNPLTPRVVANRYWQMLFGTGLVKTAEDFGAQGEYPSHPQLLDWLATEITRTRWDMKSLLRKMVNSATYRQSSTTTPTILQRDPHNRFLTRGPRHRLRAETIRDQALSASGLLVERLGGPSVRPYQPDGLWKEIASVQDYQQSHGADLYRRSLYTYWKRTVAPPMMTMFDASTRETCVVLQTRTNTPLQALALMNDVTFVECSRVLAQRAMRDGGESPRRRIIHAFRLVMGRAPSEIEIRVLVDGFREHKSRYGDNPEAAKALIRTGEYPLDESLDEVDLAAYTIVTSLILNLDEAVSKE